MSAEDREPIDVIIAAYRRIRAAAKAGRGVRFTADEVDIIWRHDPAVYRAVSEADERESR